MSGISSLSGSTTNSLATFSPNVNGTKDASRVGSSANTRETGPEKLLLSELEKQGYTGSALEDLQTKIEAAVETVKNSSGGQVDPRSIHEAVTKVLQEAGVDTDKIDADLKARGPHGPRGHHGPPPADNDADATASDSATGSSPDIDALLKQLGVDPDKFKSALQSAISNIGSDGSVDLSQLFASAAVGSQVDVVV